MCSTVVATMAAVAKRPISRVFDVTERHVSSRYAFSVAASSKRSVSELRLTRTGTADGFPEPEAVRAKSTRSLF